jgi:hypothetical protein
MFGMLCLERTIEIRTHHRKQKGLENTRNTACKGTAVAGKKHRMYCISIAKSSVPMVLQSYKAARRIARF